jgi:hypothetical protein
VFLQHRQEDEMKFVRLARVVVCLALLSLPLGSAALAADKPTEKGVAGPLPETAKYWTVFRHLTALEAKAAEVERRGQDGAPYRAIFRISAKLTEAQASELSSIANDCVARVEEKDREALAIIRAARAASRKEGGIPAEPPAELERLQRERDALITEAREELRRTFGDKEFTRFQGFVDEKVAPAIRRERITQPLPSANGGRR